MKLLFQEAKPFLVVVFLQVGFAGMDIISKAALNEGMSNYVFVVYRNAIATIFMPVIGQILYFLGMEYTTATFAASMTNTLAAITFTIACLFRLERIRAMSIRSQAKIIGTGATVAGAMIMTFVQGPNLNLPWTRKSGIQEQKQGEVTLQHTIIGGSMIIIGCFSWACFMILQAVTLRTYPAELSLTAWICLLATAEAAVVALVMEKGNASAWSIKWDMKLLAASYTGIFCSGIAYYLQGVVMKSRGPVFVTAFSPLNMVIVAVLSSFILDEQMYLGRLIGAFVIVIGLYSVLWGKNKDYKTDLIENEGIPVINVTPIGESQKI
ncbi:hypothetical protein ACJIZ3_005318 [Penstemon smallii]|uniref:WAT1-related protein n=1 Tax=Penstemon smallii TaxID=265156 RepID=A0ABD3S4K6_9LAMI